jgi:hypothetical protein
VLGIGARATELVAAVVQWSIDHYGEVPVQVWRSLFGPFQPGHDELAVMRALRGCGTIGQRSPTLAYAIHHVIRLPYLEISGNLIEPAEIECELYHSARN